MRQLIIGLTGRMGCGKTTIAEHLKREHGFLEYSFADPLKEMACSLLQIDRAELERLKRTEEPILPALGADFPTMRQTLQRLGTEWGREQIHPELWIAIARQRLQRWSEAADLVRGIVISDVRFENEASFVREIGGVIVHVRNLRADATLSEHVSEQILRTQPEDLELANNRTLPELYEKADRLLHRLDGFAGEPGRGAA